MNKRLGYVVAGVMLSGGAAALDAVGQRYVDQLVKGGPVSIRQAAQSIYHTGMKDTEVLDVAAEVLVQQYGTATANTEIDAMAWVCKALGESGNGRYTAVLNQVAEGDVHRKLAKHCSTAAKKLPAAGANAYKPGSVNLSKYQGGAAKSQPAAAAKPAPAKAQAAGKGSFSDIVQGMSMDEVHALLGAPSASYAHQTGKAWIPFNFKGGDVARQVYLYQGRGRIIFSNESAYSSVWRVLEVIEDPNESGYP